ncbi:hypothetical protein OEZ86_000596 [Tetradesmus obliquus]|nr:hypothetical protein OEZ86_000596 [Tetradesmus obliquus]
MCPPEGLKQQVVVMGQPHWACRVGYALTAAWGVDKAALGVEAVLPQLVSGDYASLPLAGRMAVLRCLLELALASETLRAHLDARIEAYTAPRPLRSDLFRAFAGALTGPQQPGPGRGRWARPGAGGGAAAGDGGPSEDDRRAAAAASDRGTAGRMLEEWMEWLAQQEQHSMGLRVPLGNDCRQRRYWLLGGVAGAWRLFCEEADGELWGYYEGEQLLHLTHWIACAAIEAELPLLHTLATMPWPYRPNLLMGPWEMARARPDGYRGLAAPLLYGEADAVGGCMLASSEARLSWGLAGLLSAAPFYAAGAQALLQQLGPVMEQAQAASTCAAYTAALLALESLLSQPELQPAPLNSQWQGQWQQRWRHSLAAAGPGSWEALLLHLALLGRHVVHGEWQIGREGFMRLAAACKCPLRFPGIGEEWMLARTPLLQHIYKYRQLPPAATAPLPPPAAELGAAADAVRKLPPVCCYKVVGVAFCAYPMPEALKKQAQPPVDESAAAAAAAAMAEFLVSPAAYEAGVRHSWLPGDRFRTYSGAQQQQQHQGPKGAPPAPRGTIMSVDESPEDEAPDPWEAITVLWDSNQDSADLEHKVSPWEIQPDQDDAAHAADTARTAAHEPAGSESTQQQGGGGLAGDADSSAAAQRAARRRASRAIDISSLIGAVDNEDDEYNPLADGNSSDSDCGGRRRKGRGRGGAGGGVTWGGDRGPKGSKRGRGSDDEDFRASDGQAPSGKRGGRAGGVSRGGAAAGPGVQQWGPEQIRQQQGAHLALKQQQMLAAMLAGNQAALAALLNVPPTAPIHDQPLPTPLKPDCLAALPCRTSFITLVADYSISLKGQFAPPMWNGRELDLYSLFMVVNVRGGYEAVCRTNRWPDVCRAMSCFKDPTAADGMRTSYEKCLVEFEQYVRRGGWEQDRQTARRPQALKEDTAAAFEQGLLQQGQQQQCRHSRRC